MSDSSTKTIGKLIETENFYACLLTPTPPLVDQEKNWYQVFLKSGDLMMARCVIMPHSILHALETAYEFGLIEGSRGQK